MKNNKLKNKKNLEQNFVLDFLINCFHLRRVVANLQHMCLCECDHPPQIKIIQLHYIIMSGRPESNPLGLRPPWGRAQVCILPTCRFATKSQAKDVYFLSYH
jgi:hypothetical protein